MGGKRCGGRARWGDITNGQRVSPTECQSACLAEGTCMFAVSKNRKCASFTSCSSSAGKGGFLVWKKTCGPDPTSAPTPAPTLPPSPPPEECRQYCEKADLTKAGRSCSYLKEFQALCLRSYESSAANLMPCTWDGVACALDGQTSLPCGAMDMICPIV